MNGMQLYDDDGQRKYLTPGERDAFLKAAEDAPREVRTSGDIRRAYAAPVG
jgi:hypothetical protein